MTLQEMFDAVWERAKTPRKGQSQGGVCAYRGADGLPCFVGALIPDDRYGPGLEGKTVSNPAIVAAIGYLASATSARFLRCVQCIHDATAPDRWIYGLRDLAFEFGLKVPE